MKTRLEARLHVVEHGLKVVGQDEVDLRLKRTYLEGQKTALQDALSYLSDSEKEKQNV